MSTRSELVIIGAGLTAATTTTELRELGDDRMITLIGDEPELPYERPPLSKGYLLGKKSRADVFVHDADWYEAHHVDVRIGERAIGIDRGAQEVQLGTGGTIGYKQLLIATGASPRRLDIPGADGSGVRTLRTIADSSTLKEALADGAEWVIIGAGWIGLEVAAAARESGGRVTVLESAAVPLERVLGSELGRYFADLHERHGVDMRTGSTVSGIATERGRLVVGTDRGGLPADHVVMAVGVRPNVTLAQAAGLTIDNGILVDQFLRTDDPAILAAGDVANAFNSTLNRHVRAEHWDNAIRHGRLAAQTLHGSTDAYDWQPYFYTDQYDMGMEYVGHNDAADEAVIRGDLSGGEFIAFWRNSTGVVTAAMNVNIWDVNDDLRALVGRQIATERLTDTAVPLSDLLPTH